MQSFGLDLMILDYLAYAEWHLCCLYIAYFITWYDFFYDFLQLVMTYEFVTLTWNEIVCYLINFLGLYKLLAPALNMNFFNSFGLFLPLVWLKI